MDRGTGINWGADDPWMFANKMGKVKRKRTIMRKMATHVTPFSNSSIKLRGAHRFKPGLSRDSFVFQWASKTPFDLQYLAF